MAANSSTAVINSLLEKLRLDDPWLPARSWDSVPSGSAPPPNPAPSLYATTSVSEPSLVRLAMNALQGTETALLSISELCALLRYIPTDRTSHRIPSLWTRCSSTSAMGDLFSSIGQFGCVVFLLRMFVGYFSNPDFENSEVDSSEKGKCPELNFSLINQAFAISVQKVIDGYVSALDTLSTSVSLRRCTKSNSGGCLSSIGHSETTLLEVYLHTTGLRAQIEALGNICNVSYLSFSFPVSSLEDLKSKAHSEFSAFPRGGALLSFLYDQLKVANPDHCSLLKFLFLQSYEPYCGFIRSWIYDGRLTDPYNEFVVESVNDLSTSSSTDAAITSDMPLPIIRVRDGVPAPCFLEECLVPICRTGQQLQVIIKLLELSNNAGTYDIHKEILPSSVDLSSKYSWFAFPLTFNKEITETMSFERAMYYRRMLEDTDNVLTKFDFSSREEYSHSDTLRLVEYIGKNLVEQTSFIDDESFIPHTINRRNQRMAGNTINSEASSISDDYSYDEDHVESYECSSSESSEEQDMGEQFNCAPHVMERNLLSALDFSSNFSMGNITQKLRQSEISCSVDLTSFKINESSGHIPHLSCNERIPAGGEPALSSTLETQVTSSGDDLCPIDGQQSKKDDVTWLPKDVRYLELIHTNSDLMDNISSKDLDMHETHVPSNLSTSHMWMRKYDSTTFSMNPTRKRDSLLDPRTLLGETHCASYRDSHFDFTCVKDPLKSAGFLRPLFEGELSVKTEAVAPGVGTGTQLDLERCVVTTENNSCSSAVSSSLHEKVNTEDISLLPSTFGGSTWESLLSRSSKISCRPTSDRRTRLLAAVEMPLDFVIRKCLLDEIILQYKYLSKLAIKLLTEGFSLQKHLLALRCYHFMELADWADLFIMSLWNRKWHVNEVDKRIPEIQGILELSVQRSSCEGDPNKERLFVFLKGEDTYNLSAPPTGIHSFDFLGLGYRVDWPVNIILTPAALNIYSEIFNFLIQVKLAVFSLSDAWCSLKSYCPDLLRGEAHQVSIITETRHKLNHFVSTLQQYVHSQLSHVSWSRFQDSLKNKVEDMLDLESVHMAYLTESLHICFLSSEARSVAGIIQTILECAMDFRSCLTGGLQYGGFKDEKPIKEISRLGISQVHAIRRTLNQNLEELHLIYLRSDKHGEFSISGFWDSLNYNEYYGGVFSRQATHALFYP